MCVLRAAGVLMFVLGLTCYKGVIVAGVAQFLLLGSWATLLQVFYSCFWFWFSPFLPIHPQPKALSQFFGIGFHKPLSEKFKKCHGSITKEQCCGSGSHWNADADPDPGGKEDPQ
jgi:hypothetical protein